MGGIVVLRRLGCGQVTGLLMDTSAAAAGATAAAAAAARLGACRRGARPAADGDRGQQLHRVIVALRAAARRGRLAHRAGLLEGSPAGPAPVFIDRKST